MVSLLQVSLLRQIHSGISDQMPGEVRRAGALTHLIRAETCGTILLCTLNCFIFSPILLSRSIELSLYRHWAAYETPPPAGLASRDIKTL